MMNNLFLLIISNIIAVPLAYLMGYKFRQYVSKERRFVVGFAVAVSVLTIALIIGLGFPMISRQAQLVAAAVSIGFPLGIAKPLYYDSTKKNVPSK